MSPGNEECQLLQDNDETSKTIGQTGLTTTRQRKATDHPTWEARKYVKYVKRGSWAKTNCVYPTRLHVDVKVVDCLSTLVSVVPY